MLKITVKLKSPDKQYIKNIFESSRPILLKAVVKQAWNMTAL